MSALLVELVRQHPDKDERLLAASSLIVRLEQQRKDLLGLMSCATKTLENLSIGLREPPFPLPKTADNIDRTVKLLNAMLAESAGKVS